MPYVLPGGDSPAAARQRLAASLAQLQRQYGGAGVPLGGRGTGPPVGGLVPGAKVPLPAVPPGLPPGTFAPTPEQLAAAVAPAAAPQYHGHLDPNYVGWGTPGLEWYGPTPPPTGGPWKQDKGVAGQVVWRSDWDPARPGFLMGEA